MAPPSPRRSSRARNSQSQQSSSSSSISSGRIDRNTRSAKTPSGKSTPSASLSEPPEELDDPHFLRRRTRAQDEERDKASRRESADMANASDDIQEDDEAVRCICGYDDYPGPPPLDNESKQVKETHDSIIFSGLDVSDDISGFYVQCDICKVWQHGACVGIMTEESSPDEYFCEQCRKDLHRIHRASNGQRYSAYLPLTRPSRSSRSVSVAKEGTRSPKNGTSKSDRASSAAQTSKRRSTMNSREAAYDEEEQLRRAIEASKELVEHDEGPTRRTKRGRSDSEEKPASVKRQRTSSRSATPPSETKSEPQEDSDDGTTTRNGSKKTRNSRSQKEKSEREERERQRQEAANKRKGRADRRRAESQAAPPPAPEKEPGAQMDVDSDPSEEMPLAAARATSVGKPADIQPTVEPLPPAPPAPDTPPPASAPQNSTHKKSARSAKKTKGRNQYTRDRDDSERSPVRSVSRDTPRTDEANGGHSRPERPSAKAAKNAAHNRVAMNDLKRRSAAFLDFIAKTQVELASEDLAEHRPATGLTNQSNGTPTPVPIDGSSPETKEAEEQARSPGASDALFKDMNCVEMMDLLTRDLVKWQNRYTA